MIKAVEKDSDGKGRNERQEEKDNVHLERFFEQEVPEEDAETWEQQESAMKKLEGYQ